MYVYKWEIMQKKKIINNYSWDAYGAKAISIYQDLLSK